MRIFAWYFLGGEDISEAILVGQGRGHLGGSFSWGPEGAHRAAVCVERGPDRNSARESSSSISLVEMPNMRCHSLLILGPVL